MQSEIAAAQSAQSPAHTPAIRVADLFRLSRAMPSSVDIPGVMLQLSHVAAETGVSFRVDHAARSGRLRRLRAGRRSTSGFEGRFYDLVRLPLPAPQARSAVHGGALHATGPHVLGRLDLLRPGAGWSFPQVQAALTVSAYVFGDGTDSGPGARRHDAPCQLLRAEDSQPIPAAPAGATAAGA